MDKSRHDAWLNGKAYDAYVGRWSRLTAKSFLSWLAIPEGSEWLDLGCGTGALSQTILEHASPTSLLGIEPSEGFLSLAKEQIQDARATFALGSGTDIPTRDTKFDVVVSGFVLNFIPDLAMALKEMKRVTKTKGLVAAYVWDYADKAEFMRYFWDAAASLDEKASEFDEGKRFPLCRPEALESSFNAAGFSQVKVTALDIPTVFKSFDDYWQPFLGGMGPAPGYVAALTEEQKEALKTKLFKTLPIATDGSVSLIARSWAVKGQI